MSSPCTREEDSFSPERRLRREDGAASLSSVFPPLPFLLLTPCLVMLEIDVHCPPLIVGGHVLPWQLALHHPIVELPLGVEPAGEAGNCRIFSYDEFAVETICYIT